MLSLQAVSGPLVRNGAECDSGSALIGADVLSMPLSPRIHPGMGQATTLPSFEFAS